MSTISTWKPKIAGIWSKRQFAADWRLPFALFVCGLLAYAAAFTWHMLASFDLINLIRDVNADDSFYYFQIAYYLAQGKFSTFDGGITQTNGYHLVWLLLITPFYWLFDKETALFGIKAFEIMLVAGGAALIAQAARLARQPWPLLFAALPMLYRNPRELLLGLEAAAAMFALALLTLAVCLYMRNPPRWKWTLASVAFALPWVRIEYIAVSLAVTAALCAIEWSRQERRSLRLSALANIRNTYIPLISAIGGILVYFAYNRLVFGGILPVSAAAKQVWSQNRWVEQGGYDFAQSFLRTLQRDAFDYELLIAFEICAYLLITWWLALRSKERRDWLLVAFLVGVFGLAAGHIAKFAQIVLTLHPGVGYAIWHFVPAYLMMALIIPIRLYVAIYLIRRFLAPRWRIAANALSVGVFVVGATVLLVIAGFAEPFRWVDSNRASTQLHAKIGHYMGAQVLNSALPEGSVIGAYDAGIFGYFTRFPVVNLDGLANSYNHFRSRHILRIEGLNFYRRYGITHFIHNHGHESTPNNVIFESAPFYVEKSRNQIRIWTYSSSPETQGEIDYSQQVWANMEPRFDYLSDGVGVIFAGRLAQAFAKDCAPDDLLAWTWRQHERTVRVEATPYQTPTGICVDSRILPHSAGQPAFAEMRTSGAHADADFEDLAGREPIIRSRFDLYIIGDRLIYAKSQCSQADVEARFFANIFPGESDRLPAHLSRRGYVTIDFKFDDYGAIAADGMCWAAVDLPNYSIAEIHAGQYAAKEDEYHYLWEGTYTAGAGADAVGMNANFERLEGHKPIIRSRFDLYIIGDRLIYAKAQCSQSDVEAPFFASVFPVYSDSLPDDIRQRGYDAMDFEFARYGVIAADGSCWAAVKLPNYPIAKIHAGQYVTTEDGYHYPWESTYHFDE